MRNFFVGAASTRSVSPLAAAREWLGPVVPRRCRALRPVGSWTSGARPPTPDHRLGAHRTLEAYGKHYTMAWPFEEHDSGCPLPHVAPVLPCAAGVRASARSWVGATGIGSPTRHSVRRRTTSTRRPAEWVAPWGASTAPVARQRCWFDNIVRQVRVEGPRRPGRAGLDLLERRAQADRLATYTQMLDDSGGIQCDLTVCRAWRPTSSTSSPGRFRNA